MQIAKVNLVKQIAKNDRFPFLVIGRFSFRNLAQKGCSMLYIHFVLIYISTQNLVLILTSQWPNTTQYFQLTPAQYPTS